MTSQISEVHRILNNCRQTEMEADLGTVSFTPKEEKMF